MGAQGIFQPWAWSGSFMVILQRHVPLLFCHLGLFLVQVQEMGAFLPLTVPPGVIAVEI